MFLSLIQKFNHIEFRPFSQPLYRIQSRNSTSNSGSTMPSKHYFLHISTGRNRKIITLPQRHRCKKLFISQDEGMQSNKFAWEHACTSHRKPQYCAYIMGIWQTNNKTAWFYSQCHISTDKNLSYKSAPALLKEMSLFHLGSNQLASLPVPIIIFNRETSITIL